jgi:hypothetical protein
MIESDPCSSSLTTSTSSRIATAITGRITSRGANYTIAEIDETSDRGRRDVPDQRLRRQRTAWTSASSSSTRTVPADFNMDGGVDRSRSSSCSSSCGNGASLERTSIRMVVSKEADIGYVLSSSGRLAGAEMAVIGAVKMHCELRGTRDALRSSRPVFYRRIERPGLLSLRSLLSTWAMQGHRL